MERCVQIDAVLNLSVGALIGCLDGPCLLKLQGSVLRRIGLRHCKSPFSSSGLHDASEMPDCTFSCLDGMIEK